MKAYVLLLVIGIIFLCALLLFGGAGIAEEGESKSKSLDDDVFISLNIHRLNEFYENKKEMAWFRDGKPVRALVDVMEVLTHADTHGLNLDSYFVTDIVDRLKNKNYSWETERLISQAAMAYIADIANGRTHPMKLAEDNHIRRRDQ
ncbi:MAG: hypothetical protein H6908_03680 [Hyphomicrobiales bacterium]|nr:hypothetical protein [Hyphomicrobiales bacterium]